MNVSRNRSVLTKAPIRLSVNREGKKWVHMRRGKGQQSLLGQLKNSRMTTSGSPLSLNPRNCPLHMLFHLCDLHSCGKHTSHFWVGLSIHPSFMTSYPWDDCQGNTPCGGVLLPRGCSPTVPDLSSSMISHPYTEES